MLRNELFALCFHLWAFLRLGSSRFGRAPDVPLDFCEDLIEALHLLVFYSIDLWSHKLCLSRCNKHDIRERVTNMEGGYYVFECCRDRFRFVLVFQVLVRHLKDALLFFPLLFILRHVTWGDSTTSARRSFNVKAKLSLLPSGASDVVWISHLSDSGCGNKLRPND